ncbi:MAG: hypothetical protein HRU38_22115, partial [Saccharospirillaceae bacterium]|nr:hypothetical protein [Pseudomonadales bacterium]NRB81325.1 hypothetical protein [Saccharospirillaceae bacterium]
MQNTTKQQTFLRGQAALRDQAIQGIHALASVVIKNKDNWFFGHTGASIISGVLLVNNKLLKQNTLDVISTKIETIIQNNQSDIYEFEQTDLSDDMSPIVKAIEDQKDNLTASGHGVIYGVLLLDVIQTFDLKVNKQVILNISQLITNSKNDNPKRFYSVDDYRLVKAPTKPIENWEEFFINVIDRSVENIYQDDGTYFFSGEKLHGITHAHAIFTLRRLGYKKLTQSLALQLLKQVDLSDLYPEKTAIKLQPHKFEPNDLLVWREVEVNDNAHQIKLT